MTEAIKIIVEGEPYCLRLHVWRNGASKEIAEGNRTDKRRGEEHFGLASPSQECLSTSGAIAHPTPPYVGLWY